MWIYEKKLQHPIRIKNTNPALAQVILDQYGGADGELGASLRYLSQRFSMPTELTKSILNDIGSEELAHLEMIGTLVHQLTKGISVEDVKKNNFQNYYVSHGTAVYPSSASGSPFTAAYLQSSGDIIADLTEDMAAEQKARKTYDNILRLSDDPDVNEVIKFLRAREIVHFQRFGEALRSVQDLKCAKCLFPVTRR